MRRSSSKFSGPHRGVALLHQPLVGDGLGLDIFHRGVAALAAVEIEQFVAGLAVDDAGELLGEIDAVVDAAVHAHAADRIVEVRASRRRAARGRCGRSTRRAGARRRR